MLARSFLFKLLNFAKSSRIVFGLILTIFNVVDLSADRMTPKEFSHLQEVVEKIMPRITQLTHSLKLQKEKHSPMVVPVLRQCAPWPE